MTETKLKSCPFCGGEAFWDSDFSCVYCRCGAEITFCESDKEAAERWNTRPIEDALKEENKRLREALEEIQDAITLLNTADVLEHISDKFNRTLEREEE